MVRRVKQVSRCRDCNFRKKPSHLCQIVAKGDASTLQTVIVWRMRLLAPMISATLALAACSGPTAAPEDVDAVTEAYTASDSPYGIPLQKAQAECIAKLYLESDLSDQALAAIRAGNPPTPKTDQDREVMKDLAGEVAADCF